MPFLRFGFADRAASVASADRLPIVCRPSFARSISPSLTGRMYRMPLSVLRRVCRLRQGERLSQFCMPSAGEAAGRKRRVPFRRLLSGVLALCRRATRNGCAVGCLLVLRKRKTRKRNAGSKGKNEKRSAFKCVPCAPRKGSLKEGNGIFAPTMPVNRLLNKKGEMRKKDATSGIGNKTAEICR